MMSDCPNWVAWVTLVAGVLYLLADLGVFNWGISWWTAAFVLMGLCAVTNK